MHGDLVVRARALRVGYNPIVSPQETSALRYLTFGRLWLDRETDYEAESGDQEVALCLLGGKATITVEGGGFPSAQYVDIGGRRSVFDGDPTFVYVPRGARYSVKAVAGPLDVAVLSAPCHREGLPALITPAQAVRRTVGAANWRRTVILGIDGRFPAERLLVGEVLVPPGNWSSYPPHKHDVVNPPAEMPMEEIYFFQIRPERGFALQCIYSNPEAPDAVDVVYRLRHGDTVLLPGGYHPVAAAPGYQVYYLWCMAGDERAFGAWTDDPDHAWVRNVEPMLP